MDTVPRGASLGDRRIGALFDQHLKAGSLQLSFSLVNPGSLDGEQSGRVPLRFSAESSAQGHRRIDETEVGVPTSPGDSGRRCCRRARRLLLFADPELLQDRGCNRLVEGGGLFVGELEVTLGKLDVGTPKTLQMRCRVLGGHLAEDTGTPQSAPLLEPLRASMRSRSHARMLIC